MNGVVQFKTVPRCVICKSRETTAVACWVVDGCEEISYFCRQHEDRASAPFAPAIKDG
jgi:hypothetical protein